MRKIISVLFLVLFFSANHAQVVPRNPTTVPSPSTTPKIRTVQVPPTSSNSETNTGIRPSKVNTTNTIIVGNPSRLHTVSLTTKLSPPSNLKRIIKINRDFESNTPSWITQFEDGELNYPNSDKPQWEFNFVWFNIPKKSRCCKS